MAAGFAVTSICFAWPGLPGYAAHCIRAFALRHEGSVIILATKPGVPLTGTEHALGQKVHWIDGQNPADWERMGLAVPDVMFCGGHFVPAFNRLAAQVRGEGGKTVLMADTNWRGGLRQRLIDPLHHRLFLRDRFDAVFVPGKSGARYYGAMGFPANRIAQGLYGADPQVFTAGPPLHTRQKKILYAGQFIERKHVLGLARAFISFFNRHPDWHLEMCGSGPQRHLIPDHPGITVRDFVQPAQLAAMMRQARALVLPSRREHWGVVVHEAALSGCALLLSTAVGAKDDFARIENSILFAPGSEPAIEKAFGMFAGWDDTRLQVAEATSRKLGRTHGPDAFVAGVLQLLEICRGQHTAVDMNGL